MPTDTANFTKGCPVYGERGVIDIKMSKEPITPPKMILIGCVDLFKIIEVIHSKRLSISKFRNQIISK